MFSGDAKGDIYNELCELLVAGGYFRARIAGLSPFDKVAGGLAWGIAASREAIDVEFVEDANIGQKIAVSENIEAALHKMKCPHALAAHQIQGLDYPQIFPVVQWLLKIVITTREENARSLREYTNMCFSRSTGVIPGEEKVDAEHVEAPKRVYRRQADQHLSTPEDQILSVLLEYGQKNKLLDQVLADDEAAAELEGRRVKDDAERERMAQMEEAELDKLLQNMGTYKAASRISGKDVSAAMARDQKAIDKHSEMFKAKQELMRQEWEKEEEARKGMERLRAKIENLGQEMQTQKEKIEETKSEYEAVLVQVGEANKAAEKVERRNKRIVAEIERVGGELAGDPVMQKALAELEQLMKKNEGLEEEKAALMAKCKKKLAEWKTKIENEKEEATGPVEENEYYQQVEAEHAAESERLRKVQSRTAKRNREIAQFFRDIDDIPTRGELVQYEKRFTELYEQVRWKFEETRQYYNRYNTLTETVTYLKKEMDLLDSVNEKFDVVMSSKSSRENFPLSLAKTVEGVSMSKGKIDNKLNNELKTVQLLADQYNQIVSKQRNYFVAVKDFQEECNMNEKLLEKLEKATQKAES